MKYVPFGVGNVERPSPILIDILGRPSLDTVIMCVYRFTSIRNPSAASVTALLCIQPWFWFGRLGRSTWSHVESRALPETRNTSGCPEAVGFCSTS
jgi:hypothetical protein